MAGAKGIDNVSYKHGYRSHKLYKTWCNIKQRCYNKKHKAYPNYGGRGISMADNWRTDFKAFFDWCINNGYCETLTLDRKNNDIGYTPDNCRFVTRIIQGRNQRTRKNSASGYKGVTIRKMKKGIKYLSLITVDKKTINLGQYDTAIEAHTARVNYVSENNLKDFIL